MASSSSPAAAAASLDDTSLDISFQSFCLQHAAIHRPIVLVSSGGTAADLEVRTVRSLENFSTGLRGALSVEQFLERGYAVVHLWRTGSASPFARVVADALPQSQQANHGLSAESLSYLLDHPEDDDDGDDTRGVTTVLEEEDNDPWLTEDSTRRQQQAQTSNKNLSKGGDATGNISLQLHHRLCNNEHLQRAWRQWRLARSENRIITVPFRTIEEYLAKLEYCSRVIHEHSQALSMMYLAAAVSDYYLPNKKEHKIQSSENPNELVLKLTAVPKVLGTLRKTWAPKSYCVSFKLETDGAVLRRKSEGAVTKYGVHMVVGNILDTRYSTVHVLHPEQEHDTDDKNENKQSLASVHDWTMTEISKAPQSPYLEIDLIEFVVQHHFAYISKHYDTTHAALATHERLVQRKKELQIKVFWKNLQDSALQVGGTLLGMTITYLVSQAIQRRILTAR